MFDNATGVVAIPGRDMSRRRRVGVARYLRLMWDAWRTRRILAKLDAGQLKDIGVSLAEARAEIGRAPWDFMPRG